MCYNGCRGQVHIVLDAIALDDFTHPPAFVVYTVIKLNACICDPI